MMSKNGEHTTACDEQKHNYEEILGFSFCRNCEDYYCFDPSISEIARKVVYNFRKTHLREISSFERSDKNAFTSDETTLFDLLDDFRNNECYFDGLRSESFTDENLLVHGHYRLLYGISKTTEALSSLINSGKADKILERFKPSN